MPYELYKQDALWREKEPRISITYLGRLHFNAAATRKLQELGVAHVQLLWDKQRGKVALKMASNGDKHTREIHYFKPGKGSGFAAKAFLTHIGYSNGKSQSLPVSFNGKLIEFSVQP